MKRTNVRKLTALFAVVALLAVSVSVISIEFVAHAKPDLGTPIRGGDVPLVKHAHLLGALSGQRQLDLSVGLALKTQAPRGTINSSRQPSLLPRLAQRGTNSSRWWTT